MRCKNIVEKMRFKGTNYIQSQSLMREKLNAGENQELFNLYLEEMNSTLKSISNVTKLKDEISFVKSGFENLQKVLNIFRSWLKKGEISSISCYSALFLKQLAECTIALLHLEAADISLSSLDQNALPDQETAFYHGKIVSAKYYIFNILPIHNIYATITENNDIDFSDNTSFISDCLLSV